MLRGIACVVRVRADRHPPDRECRNDRNATKSDNHRPCARRRLYVYRAVANVYTCPPQLFVSQNSDAGRLHGGISSAMMPVHDLTVVCVFSGTRRKLSPNRNGEDWSFPATKPAPEAQGELVAPRPRTTKGQRRASNQPETGSNRVGHSAPQTGPRCSSYEHPKSSATARSSLSRVHSTAPLVRATAARRCTST